jgi:hypothetical protein
MSKPDNKTRNEMTREDFFAYYGNDPQAWAFHGVGLLRSAYVMWRAFWEQSKQEFKNAKTGSFEVTRDYILDSCTDRLCSSYKLLVAMAMENIAKGLVIAKGKGVENHTFPKWFFTHDTGKLLIKKADFPLDEQEKRVLNHSSKAIGWQTRYPVPGRASLLQEKFPGDDFMQLFDHPVDFRNLATRMLNDYPDEMFKGGHVSGSDLIEVLKRECPPIESLNN